GKYRRTRLFVMTLGYSRKSVRLLIFKSSSRTWAELHEKAFRRLGGAVRIVVLDNLREGVLTPATTVCPVTDHFPPFQMLEPFITLFTQIDPAKDWVHFHCHGGDGRTTTFLALYDMAYWATVYRLTDFPKQFDKFAERQCLIFDHVSLNPDKDCKGGDKSKAWK